MGGEDEDIGERVIRRDIGVFPAKMTRSVTSTRGRSLAGGPTPVRLRESTCEKSGGFLAPFNSAMAAIRSRCPFSGDRRPPSIAPQSRRYASAFEAAGCPPDSVLHRRYGVMAHQNPFRRPLPGGHNAEAGKRRRQPPRDERPERPAIYLVITASSGDLPWCIHG